MIVNTKYYFVESIDTWSFRGNRAFGTVAGSYGDTSFPPLPSVLAGAFRSLLLGQDATEIERFVRGERPSDTELGRILGTLSEPGSFQVSIVTPARRNGQKIQAFLGMPSDIVIAKQDQRSQVLQMGPQVKPAECICGFPDFLPYIPVLRQSHASKPESGWLFTGEGMRVYQEGGRQFTEGQHIIRSSELWGQEFRVGIGLHADSHSADDGKLFSLRHTAPKHDQEAESDGEVGLLVGLSGCEGKLPNSGWLRLGGDGRGASYSTVSRDFGFDPSLSEATWSRMQQTGTFKLMMRSPGLFSNGWLPDGIKEHGNDLVLEWRDIRARLICASVPRYTVISGWNLAEWKPKIAQRAVPTGTVYWFELLEGGLEQLCNLANHGLWIESEDNYDRQRQAEGFNQIIVAAT